MPDEKPSRIEYLDGLRGLAISAVMLFHAYARWPGLYPYGGGFVGNPLFDSGWDGVRLFFMISGFVILMTLRRSDSFWEFVFKRWLQLLPAMLICSVIIFFDRQFFRRKATRNYFRFPTSFLASLSPARKTEIICGIGSRQRAWRALSGLLYVEVKFYLIFGLVYFIFGQRAAIAAILCLFVMGIVAAQLHLAQPDNNIL